MTDYKTILYEEKGPIRLITLNRPETLNAIGEGMEEEIHDALDLADDDDDARVIIITGAGRAFSSGYDIGSARNAGGMNLDTMMEEGQNAAEHISRWFKNDRKMVKNQTHILELSKPVIACVHGWCMGGHMAGPHLRHDVRFGGRHLRPAGGPHDLQHQLSVDAVGRLQKLPPILADRRPCGRQGSPPHRSFERGVP